MLRPRRSPPATTRRLGSLYGSGRSRTALVTEKIAVDAPMPSAIVTIAVIENTGLFSSVRTAYLRPGMAISPRIQFNDIAPRGILQRRLSQSFRRRHRETSDSGESHGPCAFGRRNKSALRGERSGTGAAPGNPSPTGEYHSPQWSR